VDSSTPTPLSVMMGSLTVSTTIKHLRDKVVDKLRGGDDVEVDGMLLSREQLLVRSVVQHGAPPTWRFNERCCDDDDDKDDDDEVVVVAQEDGADEYDKLFEDDSEFLCLRDTELLSELDVKDGKLTVHAYLKSVRALTVTVVVLGDPSEYRDEISTVASCAAVDVANKDGGAKYVWWRESDADRFVIDPAALGHVDRVFAAGIYDITTTQASLLVDGQSPVIDEGDVRLQAQTKLIQSCVENIVLVNGESNVVCFEPSRDNNELIFQPVFSGSCIQQLELGEAAEKAFEPCARGGVLMVHLASADEIEDFFICLTLLLRKKIAPKDVWVFVRSGDTVYGYAIPHLFNSHLHSQLSRRWLT
jgi:hypothetical protein